MSCETNSIVVPRDRISSIRRTHFCWKKTSPTLSASSTTNTSGSRHANIPNASRTTIPLL